MKKPRSRLALSILGVLLAAGALAARVGASPTSHPVTSADLGGPVSGRTLEAVVDAPGPVVVETVVGAAWHVPLSGMLDLDHPKAKAAGLVDHEEPIHVAFHALRHPTRGTFLVDTGTERALFEDPKNAALRGLAAGVMHVADMKRVVDTKTWIDAQGGRVEGVLLTHLHADHIAGMRDVPAGTPVFVGPGEASTRSVENFVVRPIVDRALEGKPALATWRFEPDPDGTFEGILDVFGDRTVFALQVPGHTAGSTAFVVRTPSGPVLFTGDTCHTVWGWQNGVPPGTFTADHAKNTASLERLRRFAERHPTMEVRLGHQSLPDAAVARAH